MAILASILTASSCSLSSIHPARSWRELLPAVYPTSPSKPATKGYPAGPVVRFTSRRKSSKGLPLQKKIGRCTWTAHSRRSVYGLGRRDGWRRCFCLSAAASYFSRSFKFCFFSCFLIAFPSVVVVSVHACPCQTYFGRRRYILRYGSTPSYLYSQFCLWRPRPLCPEPSVLRYHSIVKLRLSNPLIICCAVLEILFLAPFHKPLELRRV